ncbi:GNAT superfamily N-acetyltransferase [Paenibacillus forsythiae]|uniref:GNAT superfamily N-acetyltransferase n=1 Tax=Paenibacillus forsythiae TaxID=365616 RepID=A0ABU3H2Z1_9BACL|nr:GNAT family N-acetyltransferase [Paenibacillus forsythiae]MDT3424831.1 GNAT superfamily N-acetyltransferase [Paenibacillus forsythiae]
MKRELVTLTHWSNEYWERVGPIYRQAFPSGAKPEGLLKNMLEKGIAVMHILMRGGEAEAMAVTGLAGSEPDTKLIIDYMAVRADLRGQGIGSLFLGKIRDWAVREHGISAIIIEVEAGDTAVHEERFHFWERCGFIRTAYVHQYIWVPEPYTAMVLPLKAGVPASYDGRSLFRFIESFHKRAYRRG